MSFSHLFPRMRRLSVERKWNSFSDILPDRYSSRPLIYFTLVFPLCSLTGYVGYVATQLWAFRELLPVVSAGYIAKNPVTIIITCVIYVCESFGGFDAVSYTDVVQGLIIIFAPMIGPCWMTGKFGPLQGTVEYGCAATYYETIPDGNTTKERARRCYAYVSPWNSVHPAGKTYSYWFKPIWPTYGVDGSYWFNNTCWIGTANYTLFYAFPIFPHVVQREFATRSDESCKRSMLFMAVCMVLAGTHGIMLGFFYAINLKPVYPASTPAFGAILDFMMRDGGNSEFSGVMSACGALAAIMSTIASATLAGTNIITKEFIVNGLVKLRNLKVNSDVAKSEVKLRNLNGCL
jgi:Na+/proline symporter